MKIIVHEGVVYLKDVDNKDELSILADKEIISRDGFSSIIIKEFGGGPFDEITAFADTKNELK